MSNSDVTPVGFINYPDGIQEAAEFLRLALPLMAKNEVPVHPANYTIWYEYVTGRNAELHKALDDLLQKDTQFTSDLNRDIFQQYFLTSDQKALVGSHASIRSLLKNVFDQLILSSGETSQYGEKLQTYSSRLEQNPAIEELQDLVGDILGETNKMLVSNQQLEKQLESATDDLKKLKGELEETRQEATTDTLTGIPNRKAFDDTLKTLSWEAEKANQPLCLILADVDHFKRFNDTFGHILGDKLLKFVSNILNDCIKGRDFVARFGGEEFVILLPFTPLKGAVAVAEAIGKTVSAQKLRRSNSSQTVGSITFSFGVAQFQHGETAEDFIQRADQALYLSKQRGRNRVTAEDALVKPDLHTV